MFRLKSFSPSQIISVCNERHCTRGMVCVCARHVTLNTLEIIVDT